jgi:hypothetical protein
VKLVGSSKVNQIYVGAHELFVGRQSARSTCYLRLPFARVAPAICYYHSIRVKSCHYKLRASLAKATMELPFALNYPVSTSELLLSPRRLDTAS